MLAACVPLKGPDKPRHCNQILADTDQTLPWKLGWADHASTVLVAVGSLQHFSIVLVAFKCVRKVFVFVLIVCIRVAHRVPIVLIA